MFIRGPQFFKVEYYHCHLIAEVIIKVIGGMIHHQSNNHCGFCPNAAFDTDP